MGFEMLKLGIEDPNLINYSGSVDGLYKSEKRWQPPLFTKQTTKITLRTLLFTKKPINPKKFKKLDLQS